MPKKFIPQVRPALRELLLAHGFVSKVYDHEPGEFLNKSFKAKEMPYFASYGIDNEFVFDTSDILLEVTPDERIQLVAQQTDYYEQPVGLFGKHGLLMISNAGLTKEQILAVK